MLAAHETITGDNEAQRPIGAMRDADARGGTCISIGGSIAETADLECALSQIRSVQFSCDAHRER